MDTLRFGIVGYGRMGKIRRRTIEATPGAEVVALCDPFEDFSGETGVTCVRDWRELVAMDLDAVVVSCTNEFISDVVVAALQKGKHVFSEKPPGRTVADIERIRQAEANAPDLHLKFGFNHRYHESVEDALANIQSGRLGRVLWMRGVYGKAGGSNYDQNWRNDPKRSGGGILLDQGIHMLDLFHYFTGEFEEIQSCVGSRFWDVPVEDNAFALMRNREGVVAMLHSSATQWRHTFRLEIALEKGSMTLEGILSSTMSYGRESLRIAECAYDENGYPLPNPQESISYYDTDHSWEREMEEFVGALRGKHRITIGTSQDALMAMRTVWRIYEADNSWAPVMLPTAAVAS